MNLSLPIKRSSVHHLQAHHHSQFEIRHGWEIVANYGEVALEKNAIQTGVALADVSWLGKLECKGDWVSSLATLSAPALPDPASVLRPPSSVPSLPDSVLSPQSSVLIIEGAVFHPLISSHAIWIVQPDRLDAVFGQLESIRAGKPRSYLINTSSSFASFELVGPRAPDVLCKLSSVNLSLTPPPSTQDLSKVDPERRSDAVEPVNVTAGTRTQAPVAGVHCLVIRNEKGFQIHFGREFGEYMWESFLDAGAEFGIRPVGLDAFV